MFFNTTIRNHRFVLEIFGMDAILWDGESVFPEKIELFKKFLRTYLASMNNSELLEGQPFHYDSESDEFLNKDIQEYYHLWSIA